MSTLCFVLLPRPLINSRNAISPMTFGEWLRQTRKRRGISVRELGRRLNISHAHVSKIENHKSMPGRDLVGLIADALEVDKAEAYRHYVPSENIPQVHAGDIDDPDAPHLYPGIEIVVDLREGPRRGTLTEKTIRAIAELLEHSEKADEEISPEEIERILKQEQ